VTSVASATHLVISPAVTGFTSGDYFTFVTATRGVGRAILSLNGWDYGSGSSNGASTPVRTTPTAWATVTNALAYIRQGFTPMNGQLKHAGKPSDCTSTYQYQTCDIGAVPVYPATAQAVM